MKFGAVLALAGAVAPVLAGTHEIWYISLLYVNSPLEHSFNTDLQVEHYLF